MAILQQEIINQNQPLMEYKASLTGEFFVTYVTLESLGSVVRIQVRHESWFKSKRFVTHCALSRLMLLIKFIDSDLAINAISYLIRHNTVVNTKVTNQIQRFLESLRAVSTQQPANCIFHPIFDNIMPLKDKANTSTGFSWSCLTPDLTLI